MSVDMTELYTLLQNLKVTPKNRALAEEINDNIQNGEYELALTKLRSLQNENLEKQMSKERERYEDLNQKEEEQMYPKELRNPKLETDFIAGLLLDPKTIAKYYILYEECYFEDKLLLEIYKGIIFTEGEAYAPQVAKDDLQEIIRLLRSNEEKYDYPLQFTNYR